MFERAALDGFQKGIEISEQYVRRTRQLHRKAGVEHVGAGHPLVHEAGFIAYLLRYPGQEGDDIMFGHRFDCVNGCNIDGGVCCPPFPKCIRRRFRNNAKIGKRFGRMRLNLEPDLEAVFRFPNGNHIWAGVTGDHVRTFCGKKWSRPRR